jgi:hypothetical protein
MAPIAGGRSGDDGEPASGEALQPAAQPGLQDGPSILRLQPAETGAGIQPAANSAQAQAVDAASDGPAPEVEPEVVASGLARTIGGGVAEGASVGNAGLDAAQEGAERSASAAGRAMHNPDPLIRSRASRIVNDAGKASHQVPTVENILRYATPSRGVLRVVSRAAPVGIGTTLEAAQNAAAGDPVGRNAWKTAGAVGGGEAGVLAAGATCEAITLTAGTPVCIAGVGLGSVLAGFGGQQAGAWVYDHLRGRHRPNGVDTVEAGP